MIDCKGDLNFGLVFLVLSLGLGGLLLFFKHPWIAGFVFTGLFLCSAHFFKSYREKKAIWPNG